MNKNFASLSILVAITLFAAAYGALVVQAQPAYETAPGAAAYEAVLGKSLYDANVVDFIASNQCSQTGSFRTCDSAGIALYIGRDQSVQTVYLYPNQTNAFQAYAGTLPLGLAASATMASVEEKLGQPSLVQAPQAGWQSALPDQSGSPDHAQYWATYKRFGLTVIYNSPSAADKNATIHALLISK